MRLPGGYSKMIDKSQSAATLVELKKLFQNKAANKPYIYLPIDNKKRDNLDDLMSPDRLGKLIAGYRKSGFGGIIPFSNKTSSIEPFSDEYYSAYKLIKSETDLNSLKLGYLDDTYLMRKYLSTTEDPVKKSCCVLTKYDYTCTEGQKINRKLHDPDMLMSIVAINDDNLSILDLRSCISDDSIDWTVPDGNWSIEEYVCEPDADAKYINMMDYDISTEYLKATFRQLLEQLGENPDMDDGEKPPIDIFIYRNIMYAGQNRRMWHQGYNDYFLKKFGFDPAPFYPLLFREFGGHSNRYKSMMMVCRAEMLIEGYLKAAADICRARGIICTGFPAESKATACSWLFGDGQLLHKYATAPGISMPFAYLYGLNGIKVAAGAADELGDNTVSADLFKYFSVLNRDIIYRESMNAFVRGVNMVFAHLGEDRTDEKTDAGTEAASWGSIFSKGDDLADFADFSTRVQTMLRGGIHVSEAAIIYPIHSLHSLVYLYQSEQSGFEYPSTPANADYMELMNNFLNYVGVDSTFIHPDLITEQASVENGVLYMGKNQNVMKFKLIILPSMSMISVGVMRIIKKFFDEGGKIIATDSLPHSAYESSLEFSDPNAAIKNDSPEDKELREILQYIFGKEIDDEKTYQSYYKNTNKNGGAAYFLMSNKSSVDGTESVSASILSQAVSNFKIAPDVYIDNMPRREFLGVVNYHLPVFMKVGIDKRLARGCSMNYIHKKYAGGDIYYITNTTGDTYEGSILLRSKMSPEEWNPYNGKIKKIPAEYVIFRGEIYTKVEMMIEASSCVFLVSQIGKSQKDIIREITGDDEVYTEFIPRDEY